VVFDLFVIWDGLQGRLLSTGIGLGLSSKISPVILRFG